MIARQEARRAVLSARAHWLPGIVVGVVALPLAMAFAIASNAPPAQGLYTAIIGAVAVSLLGEGSPGQYAQNLVEAVRSAH